MELLQTIFRFNHLQFQSFILIVTRISGICVAAPVFSNRNIPSYAKIALCMFLAAMIFPFIQAIDKPLENNLILFAALGKEFSAGIVMGFFVSLVFVALQLAGQFMDYQSGFGLVNILDPESQVQVPLMGQFLYIMAMLLFFVIGGHHLVIRSLVQSFEVLPLGFFKVDSQVMLFINTAFAKMIVLAFKISAPVVGAVFISEMAYGVMARAIPQMNTMIVGLPLKIGLSVFVLMLVLPLFFWVMKKEVFNIFLNLKHLFNLL